MGGGELGKLNSGPPKDRETQTHDSLSFLTQCMVLYTVNKIYSCTHHSPTCTVCSLSMYCNNNYILRLYYYPVLLVPTVVDFCTYLICLCLFLRSSWSLGSHHHHHLSLSVCICSPHLLAHETNIAHCLNYIVSIISYYLGSKNQPTNQPTNRPK